MVDVPTIINLVVQRDDRNILQFVAQVAGDYGKVIGLLMTERRHSDIIAIFEDTPFEKISSLLYKTLPVLIEFEPEATVQLMLNKAQLSLTGVLPTLFGYCSAVDKLGNSSAKSVLTTDYSGKRIHYAIYYLCQRLQSSSHFSDIALLDGISVLEEHTDLPEPQLVHTLIGMLAKYEADEVKMIAIIQKIIDLIELEILTENSNRYDYEYIMRQCRLHHKIRGGVLCWILLGSLESAVREALNVDIDMAKNIIKNCKSASNPRSLWFLVAQHALEGENDAQKAIDLITESDSILSIDVS